MPSFNKIRCTWLLERSGSCSWPGWISASIRTSPPAAGVISASITNSRLPSAGKSSVRSMSPLPCSCGQLAGAVASHVQVASAGLMAQTSSDVQATRAAGLDPAVELQFVAQIAYRTGSKLNLAEIIIGRIEIKNDVVGPVDHVDA